MLTVEFNAGASSRKSERPSRLFFAGVGRSSGPYAWPAALTERREFTRPANLPALLGFGAGDRNGRADEREMCKSLRVVSE